MRPAAAATGAGAIRVATDAAAIAAIYQPYFTDTPISFEVVPPDAAEIARRMTSDPPLPWLVATSNDGPGGGDRIVGYAYASQHRARAAYRWAADCTVYLAADHHRVGIGGRLYSALFDELRKLGYTNVFAGITLPNAASVGVHEALGFSQLGDLPPCRLQGRPLVRRRLVAAAAANGSSGCTGPSGAGPSGFAGAAAGGFTRPAAGAARASAMATELMPAISVSR